MQRGNRLREFLSTFIIFHKARELYYWEVAAREDKTIEIAVPFPAPEKGDNLGLSPDDYCSPGMSPFVPCLKKPSPFPENH